MTTYFLKHVKDLQFQIVLFCFLLITLCSLSFIYSDQWIYILIKPLLLLQDYKYFIVTDLIELFYLKLYLSMTLSFYIALLCILFQSWFFCAPGLYKSENKIIFMLLVSFLITILILFYIIFSFLIPHLWFFFTNVDKKSYSFIFNIFFEPKLDIYVFFILKTIFLIILMFQYPFAIIVGLSLNIITLQQLTKFRKLFYLKILLIASIMAPPDVWSQISIFSLLFIFIELILLIFFICKDTS